MMGGEGGYQANKPLDGGDKASGGDQGPSRKVRGKRKREIMGKKLEEKQKCGTWAVAGH